MECKIGEIFEYKSEWYQCIEADDNDCTGCDLVEPCPYSKEVAQNTGFCSSMLRNDGKSVIFKKLEKVGEPYEYYVSEKGIIQVQDYLLADPDHTVYNKIEGVYDYLYDKVVIEIKQNKEDMGDNNDIRPYDELFSPVTVSNTKYLAKEDMEEKKLNLKPFDIQKAREGKPVCTRDGRKARIICFDVKAKKPIAALITNDDTEEAHFYYDNGRSDQYQEYRYDLMMLPEKHEGWINIYKDGENSRETERAIFETEEIAKINKCNDGSYITSIKIEWEE